MVRKRREDVVRRSITLPSALYEKLARYAYDNFTTVNAVIVNAVKEFLRNREIEEMMGGKKVVQGEEKAPAGENKGPGP